MMATVTIGRRERKKLETRRALEAAALDLFACQGFDATTIEEITEAADVSLRTFFRYFATKEDVVLADQEERLALLRRVLDERPLDEPILLSVRKAVLALADCYYQEQRDAFQIRMRLLLATPSLAARNLALQLAWEDTIVDALTERLPAEAAADLYARLVASTSVAALRVAITTWLDDEGQAPLPKLVAETLDTLAAGFNQITTTTKLVPTSLGTSR